MPRRLQLLAVCSRIHWSGIAMTRRTLVSGVACALALVFILTPAVPQAQGQAGPPAQPGQQSGLTAVEARVQALEEAVADLSAALDALSMQVGTLSDDLQAHIAGLSTQLNGFQQLLDQFNQALGTTETDIATLDAKVTEFEEALADLGGGLTSYDQLHGLPCTTALGTASTVKLAGLLKAPICAERVSANGRFADFGLVVLDTQTNLMWEKKTTTVGSGENFADLHDVDNTYNWFTATGDWIAAVNTEVFAGFSNWRVPTKDELLMIQDTSVACGLGTGTPCIDPIFGATQASNYWSSTDYPVAGVAWFVRFATGGAGGGDKIFGLRARAVRRGP